MWVPGAANEVCVIGRLSHGCHPVVWGNRGLRLSILPASLLLKQSSLYSSPFCLVFLSFPYSPYHWSFPPSSSSLFWSLHPTLFPPTISPLKLLHPGHSDKTGAVPTGRRGIWPGWDHTPEGYRKDGGNHDHPGSGTTHLDLISSKGGA